MSFLKSLFFLFLSPPSPSLFLIQLTALQVFLLYWYSPLLLGPVFQLLLRPVLSLLAQVSPSYPLNPSHKLSPYHKLSLYLNLPKYLLLLNPSLLCCLSPLHIRSHPTQ